MERDVSLTYNLNSKELLNGPPCLIYRGSFVTFFCSIMWKIFNLGI